MELGENERLASSLPDKAESLSEALPAETPRKTLADERREIMEAVVGASTQRELNDLTALFNANLAKTEMARAGRQSDLLDKVIEHARERIENHADALSDKDLLGYMSAFYAGIGKSRETFNRDVQASPVVLVNNGSVSMTSVGDGGLDRESRERVMDAVKGILSQLMSAPEVEEAEWEPSDSDDMTEEEDDDEGNPDEEN